MNEFTTPMMKQYSQIKKKYSDCLLFFRLGDFYELFMEDAHIGSQVLGITLTGRPRGKDGKIPMAGVPFHAVDSYLSKLVKAGYKVAICEQMTEPNKKGIVEREVVRIVTPGTLLDERALNQKEHNYICALNVNNFHIAMTYCDITTGDFWAREYNIGELSQTLSDELAKARPAEVLLPPELHKDSEIMDILSKERGISVFPVLNWKDYSYKARDVLKKHFNVKSLASFNLEDKPLVIETSALLINYLKETQKNNLSHIKKIVFKEPEKYVHLDRATIVNLELFSTIRDREVNGSLLQTIDQTQTAMGGRLLKTWLLQPLTNKSLIEKRLDCVTELKENSSLYKSLRNYLKDMNDLERILSRVSVGIGNARDLISLAINMRRVFEIKHLLVNSHSILLQKSQKNISTKLWDLISLIENSIVSDPSIHLKEGGIIKENVNQELDSLRETVKGGRVWISNLENSERKRTGISSLKLRFNKVFGFYIEISNSNLSLVPDNYIRKQTLVNGERYITPELKEIEEMILKSEDQINLLEYSIYKEILEKVLTYTESVQESAQAISIIDCLLSHTTIAIKSRSVKPTIVYSHELRIKDGRHPVVEETTGKGDFVPNSINFGPSHGSLYLVTGPNMAGKSVYLRQTAVLVLMSLIGSFIPAKSAQIPIVDAIFVRSGASDVITSGLSTFMVEMVETAYILNHATEKSLIIMDEIGRGTSTYDGVSIAWSTAKYIVTHFKPVPKTLFATHYFELTKLEEMFPGKIKNLHMEVSDEKGKLAFLHSVKQGPASKSFGVAVASLAGIPNEVITDAKKMLYNLENEVHEVKAIPDNQNRKVTTKISNINIEKTTPIEALNILSDLKKIIRE